MAGNFQRKNPAAAARVMELIEGGLDTNQLANLLFEENESKLLQKTEGTVEDTIPDEVRIISQAMAYRQNLTDVDFGRIFRLLNSAYCDEINGPESFREGDSVNKAVFESLVTDRSYKWLIAEAPNGQGLEEDGAIIGVSCYSTDGTARKNGKIKKSIY
jgi:hypothetical protein